jgi:hypothetical protein
MWTKIAPLRSCLSAPVGSLTDTKITPKQRCHLKMSHDRFVASLCENYFELSILISALTAVCAKIKRLLLN